MLKKKKPIKKLKNLPIYLIEWDDHCSAGTNWHDASVSRDFPIKCQSVGFIVKDNKKVLTVAQNINESHVADLTVILKSCITKKVKLG